MRRWPPALLLAAGLATTAGCAATGVTDATAGPTDATPRPGSEQEGAAADAPLPSRVAGAADGAPGGVVPAGWPTTLLLGLSNDQRPADDVRAIGAMGFRATYLAGGVTGGDGWATWEPDGRFVTSRGGDDLAAGLVPVFTYYMLRQSAPGAAADEPTGIVQNLTTPATMAAYYHDLRLFMRRADELGGPVTLHVEPDLWGYLQQRPGGVDGTVAVASSGVAELAGLPDTVAGFAGAIVALRDAHAPDVVLGYHLSPWATGTDIVLADPPDTVVADMGRAAADFYRALGADFDVAFTDLADRDAGFEEAHGDGPARWYDADDYRRSVVHLHAFSRASDLRLVLWQVPLGNTRMRAMDDTWGHYRDNKVEWLLAEPAHLAAYADAGVVAVLFGMGSGGVTCACDAMGDGVTDPPPLGGADRPSLSADDDGGYFDEQAAAYAASGPLRLRRGR